MKDLLRETLRDYFLARHPDAGLFKDGADSIQLELPRDPSHGDLASNVAMATAKRLGLPPRELAGELAAWCNEKLAGRARAEVAGPGFLNFRLDKGELQSVLATILERGADFGRSEEGARQAVNLEYVSANPTGPPVVVSARAAAFGSTLAALFEFAGYRPTREYFLNDAGQQVRNLGASLRARWIERQGGPLEIPENGYHGHYLKEMADALEVSRTETWMSLPEDDSIAAFADYAVEKNRVQIADEMERFRSPFDVWFSEKSLHESGKLESALRLLEEKGVSYRSEGALWFRTTDFGDDKDRVLVKSDGVASYFLADLAYAIDKRERGFDKVIYVLGPDHHSHVARLKAVAEAIGAGSDWLEVILLQWVTLVEDGRAVAMSKRAGEFVSMADLVGDVGVDVARTYFLTRRAESHLEFDLVLAREQSSKSPVFYAQYATARIAGLLRKAAEEGLAEDGSGEPDLARLESEEELALIKGLELFPSTVAGAAAAREPNRLFNYLNDVATLFHRFYHEHQIVSDDRALSLARLALCRATRQVFVNGLGLMGVDAPERM